MVEDAPGIIRCAARFPHYKVAPHAIAPLVEASIAMQACYVAQATDGRIVGFIVGLVLPHPFSGRPYLDIIALWVEPDYRVSTAGLGLLRKMLRFQWTEPLELVKIAVADSRLRTYLHRLGFRDVETVLIKGDAWQQFLS